MRVVSIFLNIILLILVIVVVVHDGWPSKIEAQLLVCVFFIIPFITIITLKNSDSRDSDSWLSLYIKRKKLEEKVKLDKLNNNEH